MNLKHMLSYLLVLSFTVLSFHTNATANSVAYQTTIAPQTSYAYIEIYGKILSRKLKVKVDLGDEDEQIEEGKKLSEILTNKKSYASVLNFMATLGYELVETLDLIDISSSSGGTSGIIFIMKKVSTDLK